MEILEAIRRKRAVRDFQEIPIPIEIINDILDSGRRAQSSRNTQPWRFIVVQNKKLLTELSKTGYYAKHLAMSTLGIFIATPDPTNNLSIMFDAGQAAAYMQLAAIEFGIGSCLVKLHLQEQASMFLNLPTPYQVNFAIAFGYPVDPKSLAISPMRVGRKKLDNLVLRILE